MNDEEVKQQKEEVIEKKDITDEVIEDLMRDEELEEELEAELEEVEEIEEEVAERKKLMSEDEFTERIDEFESKNHGLTLMIDRFFKLLSRWGKKKGVEIDLELWDEVAKPSLNVGFWYYQLVEGQNLMVSYPKISLGIGLLATVIIGISALSQIKSKKEKEEVKEKAQKNLEGKKVKEEKEEAKERIKERIEELKVNSDILERVNKNLSS